MLTSLILSNMDPFYIYKHLPICLQNLLVSYQGGRLEKLRYNDTFWRIMEESNDIDSWSASKIKEYKEAKLFQIIDYAYKHVPFYKSFYDSYGVSPKSFTGIEDLSRFPILRKNDIRLHLNEMISDEFQRSELIKYHTSGSTGMALDFFWSKQNIAYYWAMVWRGRARYGVRKGDLSLNLTGKLVCPFEQIKPPYWRYNKPGNQFFLNMQHLTKEKISSIIPFLNQNQFAFFSGYPSIINMLAFMIEDSGMNLLYSPRYIFTSAEKLYSYQKRQIEKLFNGSKVIEHYGFAEEAACANKCKAGHYHEEFQLGHMELVDTTISDKGTTGKLVVTGIQNLAMPLIRYDVGDTATFTDRECSCGLKSQMIVDIEGRNEDYIVTPEGARVMRFGNVFKNTKSIRECQVVQRAPESLVFRIVRYDDYSMETEREIKKRVHEIISPSLKVEFEYVNEIERTKSGKFKAVINEVGNENNISRIRY